MTFFIYKGFEQKSRNSKDLDFKANNWGLERVMNTKFGMDISNE